MQVLSRDFANQLGVLQRELLTVVSELRTQMSEMTARVTAVEANGQAPSQSMPPDGPLEDPALAGRRATGRAHVRAHQPPTDRRDAPTRQPSAHDVPTPNDPDEDLRDTRRKWAHLEKT